jgi:hypothetical protein
MPRSGKLPAPSGWSATRKLNPNGLWEITPGAAPFSSSAPAYFSGRGEGVLFPNGPRSLQRPETRRRRADRAAFSGASDCANWTYLAQKILTLDHSRAWRLFQPPHPPISPADGRVSSFPRSALLARNHRGVRLAPLPLARSRPQDNPHRHSGHQRGARGYRPAATCRRCREQAARLRRRADRAAFSGASDCANCGPPACHRERKGRRGGVTFARA